MQVSLVVEQLSGQERGQVVHRVSFVAAPGDCLTLLGPPESGAQLLLRLLAGQPRASHGRIWLDGREIGALPAGQRPLGLVSLAGPLPRRSLRDLLVAGSREGLADLLGLRGLEGAPLRQLMPALRARAALALALANRPRALLLPEPGHGLAPGERDELYTLLAELAQTLQIPLLTASVEPEVAFALAGRVGVMHGGRLLEIGSTQEIYLRPQTDIGAAALGPVNLLVGSCVGGGVQVGPFVFPTHVDGAGEGQPRVQLMVRPEDLELAAAPDALAGATLGRVEVAALRYAGPVERLRLRLPAIPGVRPVAPTPPFGEAGVLIEAARTAEQARPLPLRAGDLVWAAVRRFHALPHPGLHLAVVGPETAARRLADMAAARLSSVELGDEPPEIALERLHRRQHCDVAVLSGQAPRTLAMLDQLLEHSAQHLLLLDERRGPPVAGLVCVSGDEGDKATVRFAARLLRHLGASATLLTVLQRSAEAPPERIVRFHLAAAETMAALGVPMRSLFRAGERGAAIMAERRQGGHDLLVLGSRVAGRRGPQFAQELARQPGGVPLLIVRPAVLTGAGERAQGGLMVGLLAGEAYG